MDNLKEHIQALQFCEISLKNLRWEYAVIADRKRYNILNCRNGLLYQAMQARDLARKNLHTAIEEISGMAAHTFKDLI